MRYFVVANSFAAPWFSDTDKKFIESPSPRQAITKFRVEYSHPYGLYAAICYASADDYHDNKKPLAKWLCNHEIAKDRATKGKTCYSFLGHAQGDFEINGQRYTIKNPRDGRFVALSEKEKTKEHSES